MFAQSGSSLAASLKVTMADCPSLILLFSVDCTSQGAGKNEQRERADAVSVILGCAISVLTGLLSTLPIAGVVALSGWLPMRAKIIAVRHIFFLLSTFTLFFSFFFLLFLGGCHS